MKIFTDEFIEYVKKCILTPEGSKNPKAMSAFMAYVSQRLLWEINSLFWRDANRHIYESVLSRSTGWISARAKELRKNNIEPTKDHPFCPSSCYASFIYAFWDIYKEFIEFLKVWKIISQTIQVTSLENDLLSCFTFNVNGKIKVACTLDQRYILLNIICHKEGELTSIDFPLHIDLKYLSYERDNLLDVNLMPKAIEKMKSKLEKTKKREENSDRPIILEHIETLTQIVNSI